MIKSKHRRKKVTLKTKQNTQNRTSNTCGTISSIPILCNLSPRRKRERENGKGKKVLDRKNNSQKLPKLGKGYQHTNPRSSINTK